MPFLPVIDRPPTPHPRFRRPFFSHHPAGQSDERSLLLPKSGKNKAVERPVLSRHWSYPFRDGQDAPRPSWRRTASERAEEALDGLQERVHEAEEHAEAGLMRLLVRGAWRKLKRVCLCRD